MTGRMITNPIIYQNANGQIVGIYQGNAAIELSDPVITSVSYSVNGSNTTATVNWTAPTSTSSYICYFRIAGSLNALYNNESTNSTSITLPIFPSTSTIEFYVVGIYGTTASSGNSPSCHVQLIPNQNPNPTPSLNFITNYEEDGPTFTIATFAASGATSFNLTINNLTATNITSPYTFNYPSPFAIAFDKVYSAIITANFSTGNSTTIDIPLKIISS